MKEEKRREGREKRGKKRGQGREEERGSHSLDMLQHNLLSTNISVEKSKHAEGHMHC